MTFPVVNKYWPLTALLKKNKQTNNRKEAPPPPPPRGGGHPDPERRVWGVVSKKIYWPFWPQFGLKIGGLPSWICHCLYEMNSSVTNIHMISKVPKPKQFYLCNADNTQSLWNSAMSSKTELPRWKDLTLVSNVNKAVLSWSLFWPSQWTMNSMNF